MKTKVFLISVFAIIANAIYAQVPGYFGHRVLFTANISPNLAFPFSVYDTEDYGEYMAAPLRIRPKFGATVDYVYNRRNTIGFKYSYTRSKLDMPVFWKDPNGNGYPYVSIAYAPALVSAHSFSLRWTKYISGNLPAPLGIYYGFSLGMGLANFRDIDGKFLNTDFKAEKGSYLTKSMLDFSSYIGVRRGIGKRLMLGANIELNWAALISIGLTSDSNPYANETILGGINGNDDFKHAGDFQYKINRGATSSAYRYSNLFNLTLEISFLPY